MAQVKTLKINSSGFPEEIDVTSDDITYASFTVNGGAVLSGTGLDMNGDNISDAGDLAFTDPTTDGITNTSGTHPADKILFEDDENSMDVGASILFPVVTDVADSVDALRIPSLAGVPSATPSDGGTGYLIWDSSGNDLYAWDGSAWDNLNIVDRAERVCNSYTAAATIAASEVVYISAADNVNLAQANADATAAAIGVANTASTATNPVEVCSEGLISGFTGLTAGSRYFLSDATAGAVTTTAPTSGGSTVIQVGFAKNATDMHLQFQLIGKKA